MKLSNVERIVLLLVCLALAVGLVTIYQRMGVENKYKTAEIVLDYNEMQKLADNSGEDIEWWLNKFSGYGAQSVAVQEETINLLIKAGMPLRAVTVSEMLKTYGWEKDYPDVVVEHIKDGTIGTYDAVITVGDDDVYDYVVTGIKERYSDEFHREYEADGQHYIVLKGTMKDLYYSDSKKVMDSEGKGVYEELRVIDNRLFNIGIGYDDAKIDLIKLAGLDVVLRPINYNADNAKAVDVYKAANERYDIQPRLYLVHGKDILGYPDNVDSMEAYVKESGLAPVLIESSTQREHLEQGGMDELVEKTDYHSLRAFTMWDFIRQRYQYYNYAGAEEIENTIFRAITERNIRVIYFKPFFEKDSSNYMTDAAEYERTFESLNARLKDHGISLGRAVPIEEFHIGAKRLSVISFGITLAAVFLFIRMFKIRHRYANILYVFALPAAVVPLIMRNVAEKGFALAAAVVFSGLAIYFFMMQVKRILSSSKVLTNVQMMIQSAIILSVSVAIALIGAVFVDSMLCDVKYFLEMDIFRGVKMAQILPFGVFAVIYVAYFVNKKDEDNFKALINTTAKIANKDIKVWYALLAVVIGAIGFIYISRTGHESTVQPTNLEMIFRNFMENVLMARPRTKEFLIAFPAIFAAVFAANKKSGIFTCLFMLASAIGTSSVINTFSHLRTPVYLSLVRTLTALGFGIVIGCIAILLLNLIYKLHIKIRESLM